MGRTRSPEKARRDDQVYALWMQRWSVPRIAERTRLSQRRVYAILAAYSPDLDSDTARAFHRGRLENLIEQIQETIDTPTFKLAPNGRLAEDQDGNPIPDVMVKIEALKTQLIAFKSARELDGLDKPVERKMTMTHELATLQKDESLAAIAAQKAAMENKIRELEAGRRSALQPPVIPGEVLPRELPPSKLPGQSSSEEEGRAG